MASQSSISLAVAHIRAQVDAFKFKRQAMNPKAYPGAERKLKTHYGKQGKIVDALYVRAGGLYASRNPPHGGGAGKASSRYRAMVSEVARELRGKDREGAAHSAQRCGDMAQQNPAKVIDGYAYGREMRQLNLDLFRASVDAAD